MRRLAWGLVLIFALLGATSGVLRAVFVDDLIARLEPARGRGFSALGLKDPRAATRPELVHAVEARFSQHRPVTYAHVILGAGYLALGLLQFSRTIRQRRPAYHRWSGRLLVSIGIVMALAGMYFGVAVPFAGRAEAVVILLVGGMFLFAIVRGFVAIRQGHREIHRRWMTRAFAIGLGITTVRFAAAALDPIMTPMGYAPATIFVLSLVTGWGLTLLGAEWWLMRGRRDRRDDGGRDAFVAALPIELPNNG